MTAAGLLPPSLDAGGRPAAARSREAPAGRIRWARELALVVALYGGYMVARALIGVHVEEAEARGVDILGLEAAFALDVERPLSRSSPPARHWAWSPPICTPRCTTS